MAKYELFFNSQSDNEMPIVTIEPTFIDLTYNHKKENDSYFCDIIRIRNGEPTYKDLVVTLIRNEYSVDDEFALINNGGEDYEKYQARRVELKTIAKELWEAYLNVRN